jgi:hypothetical protein
MATRRRADMFTADGQPFADDPREGARGWVTNAPLWSSFCDVNVWPWRRSGPTSMLMRWHGEVLVGMIEKYARDMGHADLLREQIDGRLGG